MEQKDDVTMVLEADPQKLIDFSAAVIDKLKEHDISAGEMVLAFAILTRKLFRLDLEEEDRVEVVRCKDCKHFDDTWKLCNHFRNGTSPEHYCSAGRRKE